MGSMGSKEYWRGDYQPHDHFSARNCGNALLCLAALAPSIAATYLIRAHCQPEKPSFGHLSALCSLNAGDGGPIKVLNVLFFLNVSVGFWFTGLLQRSMWLIDPYWTILPPLIGHFYQVNPRAATGSNAWRSRLALSMVWIWSARLTWSYFRRKEWKFGQREDWRYTNMAQDYPRLWPLLSFFRRWPRPAANACWHHTPALLGALLQL